MITDIASVHAATLHDALQRAYRIAPTKGAAFDKAAGIHLTFQGDRCEVRATDTEVTFWQEIPAEVMDRDGEALELRLPSMVLVPFIASLPMSGEQKIKFRVDDANPKQIIVKFANTKLQAKMNQIVGAYPLFGYRSVDEMMPAQELASKLESVSWAVGDTGVLQGVLVDGDQLYAMDSKRAARVPCAVEVDEPVVALLTALTPLVKLGTDIRIRVEGSKVLLALDEKTQVTTTVISQPYPDAWQRLVKMREEMESQFSMNRGRLTDALNRLLIGVRNDRQPRCSLTIKDGSLDMKLIGGLTGEIEDLAAISDQVQADDNDVQFIFNPTTLVEALDSFSGSTILIKYSTPVMPWHISTPDQYEAWVMPIDPRSVATDS